MAFLSRAQERVPKVEDKSWGRMSVKWSVQKKTKDQTSGSVKEEKEEEEEDSQPLKSLAFSSLDGVGRVGSCFALPYLTLP